MAQDDIYRILLELKETTGSTNAKLTDIKETLVKVAKEHDILKDKHDALEKSHNSIKGKVIWVSGFIGSIFGATFAWLKIEWNKLFS